MKKSNLRIWAGRVISASLVVLAIFVFTQVDDWSRDLTTNYAGLEVSTYNDRNECVEATLKAIKELGWVLIDDAPIHAVRSSTMGFKDDVYVYITGFGDVTIIRVWSKSRVGIGDLGQNPRNIVAFLQEVDKQLQEINND
jgi:hypothetical protein